MHLTSGLTQPEFNATRPRRLSCASSAGAIVQKGGNSPDSRRAVKQIYSY
jgi:hypothetical protein